VRLPCPAVGQHQQVARAPVAVASDPRPPARDRLGGELRGVGRGADDDMPLIGQHIVQAVGDRPVLRVAQEIVNIDRIRLPPPRRPGVREVAA